MSVKDPVREKKMSQPRQRTLTDLHIENRRGDFLVILFFDLRSCF